MHFCLTGQYTPHALNGMMDNPTVNRYEAAKKLIKTSVFHEIVPVGAIS